MECFRSFNADADKLANRWIDDAISVVVAKPETPTYQQKINVCTNEAFRYRVAIKECLPAIRGRATRLRARCLSLNTSYLLGSTFRPVRACRRFPSFFALACPTRVQQELL